MRVHYGSLTYALTIAILLPFHAFSAEPPLPSPENGTLTARYNVHWGLLRIADIAVTWKTSDEDYSIALYTRTRGLLRAIFKAEAALSASGSVENAALTPRTFITDSSFNKKIFGREMRFDNDGRARIIREIKPEDFKFEREPVPNSLQYGPDPMTVFLDFMLLPGTVPGTRSFDGVQVVETRLQCNLETEALSKTRRSIFHGQAQRCNVTGDVIAGDVVLDDTNDVADDVDGRDFETLIWFARTLDQSLRIPVRVKAASNRGTLKIYLTEITGGVDERVGKLGS
ncbi:MAG: DUF3108 domain-containing protein [Pseudomonadota bacterium]